MPIVVGSTREPKLEHGGPVDKSEKRRIIEQHSRAYNHEHHNHEFIAIVVSLFFFFFLRLYLWHVVVSGLRVRSELQLPAFTTAMATPDLSHICNLC